MQVILLEKNEKLGNLGDIANVKSGYARNYLIPQGKAKPANKANLAAFETIRAELEANEANALSDAQAKESAMTDIVCSISANAGEEGKLYGSVSPADIVENLLAQGLKLKSVTLICLKLFDTPVNMRSPYLSMQRSLLQ